MVGSSNLSVVLTAFRKKLHGGSQPILAEASDGALYVIKFVNNLQGRNVCFNEAMGTELYRACKLPVPLWKPILVTDSFIDQNHSCWIETQQGFRRPSAGFCFGSRYTTNASGRMIEILHSGQYERIIDSKMFWLAWLIDRCANHVDNRQAIFAEMPDKRLKPLFIDHGNMFGGASGNQTAKHRSACYLDSRIYPKMAHGSWMDFRNLVAKLDTEYLWRVVDNLPPDWKTESSLRGFAKCLERITSTQIVEDAVIEISKDYGLMSQYEQNNLKSRRDFVEPLLRTQVLWQQSKRTAIA